MGVGRHVSEPGAQCPELAAGDRSAAFDAAYAKYYPRACRFASRRFGADGAPDLVQEAFARLWRRWDALDHERELWPLLRTIIERLAIKAYYQGSRLVTVEVLPPLADGEDTTVRDVLDSDAASFVRGCLGRMRAADRELLVAHHLHGASLRALADQHYTTEATIRGRLYRAREKFRTLYRRAGGPLLVGITLLRHPARTRPARILATRRRGATIGTTAGLGLGFISAAIAFPGPKPLPDPTPTPSPHPTVSVSLSPRPLPVASPPASPTSTEQPRSRRELSHNYSLPPWDPNPLLPFDINLLPYEEMSPAPESPPPNPPGSQPWPPPSSEAPSSSPPSDAPSSPPSEAPSSPSSDSPSPSPPASDSPSPSPPALSP